MLLSVENEFLRDYEEKNFLRPKQEDGDLCYDLLMM